VALACLTILAGCGGSDGGDESTTRTVAGHTITAPTTSTPSNGSTGTRSTTTLPSTITLPSGQEIQRSDLTPFRDCLRRHGVDPDESPGGFGSVSRQQIEEAVRAFRACASLLPAPLKERYEEYRRRLQERRQGG
jgi:hypothetical protein